MVRTLITASFILGLVPAVILAYLYGLRTRWNTSQAGRALFALLTVNALSYTLSVVTLIWPHVFDEHHPGVWIRIVTRIAIAGVLWNLLRLLRKVQRDETREQERIND